MTAKSLLASVEEYYTDKVNEYGPTPRGVDWNGAHGQEVRFDQLLGVLREVRRGFSLNDYGCGYGALVERLPLVNKNFEYNGYDLSSAMIEQARLRYGADPRARFTTNHAELLPADFTVASGIFNVKLEASADEWSHHVLETISQMARLSRCGFAFNALTVHSDADRMRPDLYYADPAELLDHCLRSYSRAVQLRHNYELYEFTVLVWLDAGRRQGRSREA